MEMSTMEQVGYAYDEGYRAFKNGSLNKFDIESEEKEYKAWEQGWNEALSDETDKALFNE